MTTTEILPPARDERGYWLPGRSANPGGRPSRLAIVTQLAQDEAPASIRLLAKMRDDETQPGAVRVACAVHLLNRGFGTPKQSVEVENHGRTLEDMLRALAKLREQQQDNAE